MAQKDPDSDEGQLSTGYFAMAIGHMIALYIDG